MDFQIFLIQRLLPFLFPPPQVWIDLEQMQGKMNERMAEAVEGACVVCPFISRQYKRSPNCMKELNYADQLGKTFLPIIVDDCDRSEVRLAIPRCVAPATPRGTAMISLQPPGFQLLKGQVGIITSNLIYIDLSRLEATLPKEAAPKMSPGLSSQIAPLPHQMLYTVTLYRLYDTICPPFAA